MSHYTGQTTADPVAIRKTTNGFDADTATDAVQLFVGDPILWEYIVTNIGNQTGRAIASPIPVVLPVTMIALSFRRIDSSMLSVRCFGSWV